MSALVDQCTRSPRVGSGRLPRLSARSSTRRQRLRRRRSRRYILGLSARTGSHLGRRRRRESGMIISSSRRARRNGRGECCAYDQMLGEWLRESLAGKGRSLLVAGRSTSGDLLKMTGRCVIALVQKRLALAHAYNQLWQEAGYGPVAWSSAPSHDWQSKENLVTCFEIDTTNVRSQDVDEIVVTFVYTQLRQERDIRR